MTKKEAIEMINHEIRSLRANIDTYKGRMEEADAYGDYHTYNMYDNRINGLESKIGTLIWVNKVIKEIED